MISYDHSQIFVFKTGQKHIYCVLRRGVFGKNYYIFSKIGVNFVQDND